MHLDPPRVWAEGGCKAQMWAGKREQFDDLRAVCNRERDSAHLDRDCPVEGILWKVGGGFAL